MNAKIRMLWSAAFALLAVSMLFAFLRPAVKAAEPPMMNHILARAFSIEMGYVQRMPYEQRLSSGVLQALLAASGELARRAAATLELHATEPHWADSGEAPAGRTQGCQNVFRKGDLLNVRVNQDCSLRRQAEEVIAINPRNPANLIAGYNDNRIGFNHGAYAWSFDGGRTWGDLVPPFFQFLMLDGHSADAFSDPTATFDSHGNAYVGGILFDVSAVPSAVVVAKSNAGIGGAFYHSPDASLSFQIFSAFPLGVVANDNDPNIFNDKEFIVADANRASPKSNNVYATWTRFSATNSPIYFSQSTDGGATWSPGIEISGANAAICTAFSGEADPSACDQDQGSHPIVGPDGSVYVAFGNGNTPFPGPNQHLIVSCPATADCSNPTSWTAPVKISDDFATQPLGPDPVTGCPAARQCLPPNGYRLDDFVEGSLSVDTHGNLYFVWADFRNGGANCGNPLGSAATATPPCDNDVFYSFSTDGGVTWSAATDITPAARFGPSAQWMPWSAVTPRGDTLWIAYYDRSYGNCEFTGCNDITLAQVRRPASRSPRVSYQRLTTSSMPNLIVANNPIEAGFLGDYMWVAADAAGHPHVVWADTRGRGDSPTPEEDIYYALMSE